MNKKIVLVFAVLIILIGAVILLKWQFSKSDKPAATEQPQPEYLPFGGDKIDFSKINNNGVIPIEDYYKEKNDENGETYIIRLVKNAIVSQDSSLIAKAIEETSGEPLDLIIYIYDKNGKEKHKINFGRNLEKKNKYAALRSAFAITGRASKNFQKISENKFIYRLLI